MLRSFPSSVFVLKYYAPIIFFGGTLVFWSGGIRWAQLIFLIPLLAGAFFHASLAVLQVPDGRIRYRRLFGWKQLAYEEIADSGVAWGGVGYLRLKRFLFPWGKLYFVLDRNEKLFDRENIPYLATFENIRERDSSQVPVNGTVKMAPSTERLFARPSPLSRASEPSSRILQVPWPWRSDAGKYKATEAESGTQTAR